MSKGGHDEVRLLDHGTLLSFRFEDCVRYHGRTSIGGVALGFRLIQRALMDLAPDLAPERSLIRVRTAFPGAGVRDALEMTTRATTRGAYEVDPAFAPSEAPEAVVGRLWFEIAVGGKAAAYQTVPGAMSMEFIELGRKSHKVGLTDAESIRWTDLKEELAARVMALRPEDVLVRAS